MNVNQTHTSTQRMGGRLLHKLDTKPVHPFYPIISSSNRFRIPGLLEMLLIYSHLRRLGRG